MKMKRYSFLLALILFITTFSLGNVLQTPAAQLEASITSSGGEDCSQVNDDYFVYTDIEGSTQRFEAGSKITITAEEPIRALYIKWYYAPDPWKLQVNGMEYPCGQKDYVQEYVEIPKEHGDVTSVTMVLGDSAERIIDIYALSDGPLPDFVHVWDDPYEEADVLLISTHADDEVLFFGGLIPTYVDRSNSMDSGNIRLQVAYFTDFFQSEPYRVQELLEGLWIMGLRNYPQLGEFYDNYSESYEEAAGQFDHDACLEYIVRTIRRFKPQVVIGQDPVNGEYGHGGHMWCAGLIKEALPLTNDAGSYPDSAAQYGLWEVPKVYFHLYSEQQIEFDARVPLESFGGKTAIEVANEAYDAHWSQSSWMWFKVSDGQDPELAEYGDKLNCTKFGLYQSTVGEDTGLNDILEHIVLYDVQKGTTAAGTALETPEAVEADPAAGTVLETKEAADADPIAVTDNETQDASALDGNDKDPDLEAPGADLSVIENDAAANREKTASSGAAPIVVILIILAVLAILFAVIWLYNRNRRRRRRRRGSRTR